MIKLNLKTAIVRPADRVCEVVSKVGEIELPYKNLVTEFVMYEGKLCLDEGFYKRDKTKVDDAGKVIPNRELKSTRSFRLPLEFFEDAGEGNAVALVEARIKTLRSALKWLKTYDFKTGKTTEA